MIKGLFVPIYFRHLANTYTIAPNSAGVIIAPFKTIPNQKRASIYCFTDIDLFKMKLGLISEKMQQI